MNEEWKNIEGYEGLYQISDQGQVKNLRSGKILKPRKSKGYYYVCLYNKGIIKQCTIHRLVALTFIDNPNNLEYVNHKNEIKTDNKASNLEWCTVKYNTNYGTGLKRHAMAIKKPIYMLNGETKTYFDSATDCEMMTGISRRHIVDVLKGRLKTAGGMKFIYA